jgi:hypothetical protein
MTRALDSLAGGAKVTSILSAIAAVLVAAILAGCGSSSSSSSTTSKAASSGQSAKQQIKSDWTAFFAASTPNAKRVALLQNGKAFSSVIAAQSKSPLAQQSQAKVSKIQVTGPKTAKVTYSVLLAGKPALSNQTGTAVKSGGVWQVSDASFCQLLALEGGAPAACPKR